MALRSDGFPPELWKDVIGALKVNHGLRELQFCAPRLTHAAAHPAGLLDFVKSLPSHSLLEEIGFERFGEFDDECALALAQKLEDQGRRCAIREVNVCHTGVGTEGALALAKTRKLDFVSFEGCGLDDGTIDQMIREIPMFMLPNLAFGVVDNIGPLDAAAIGSTIGRHSVVVTIALPGLLEEVWHSMPDDTADGVVPGCFLILDRSDEFTERLIGLFETNAQLKHIWFISLLYSKWKDNFAWRDGELERLKLHQTLNRKLPWETRQQIIAKRPLSPTSWCEALGAVSDESLACIYHLVAQWRLEGCVWIRTLVVTRSWRSTRGKHSCLLL